MTVKKIKAYCSLLYEAEDGMAAVTAYQSALEQGIVFDAILMDSSMPCMDGKSD
jgi:CheY-like chemotaxis protein